MPSSAAAERLTQCERLVMHHYVAGFTRDQIAAAMFVSPHTIDAHLKRAKLKLGARNMAQAGARYAEMIGLDLDLGPALPVSLSLEDQR